MIRTFELLTAHPFLTGMPDNWLERLSFQAHPVVRNAGQRLFHEGSRADRFWLLRSGRISLDFHVAGRGEIAIDTVETGSVLGWSWLYPPYRWRFGAVPTERVLAIEFDGPGVRRLMAEDDALGRELTCRFMGVVVGRLQATRIRLSELYGYPEPVHPVP
jgi:CRP-like cAMP-binding protein